MNEISWIKESPATRRIMEHIWKVEAGLEELTEMEKLLYREPIREAIRKMYLQFMEEKKHV